jgi:tetrahydromethanopterin S-methyltransferase subunit G
MEPAVNEEALWREIDKCRTERGGLALAQAKTDGKVDLLESRLNTIGEAMTQHRSESRESLGKIEKSLGTITTKIEAISLEAAQNRGAGMSRREVFAWAGSAVGLVVGLIALVKYFS